MPKQKETLPKSAKRKAAPKRKRVVANMKNARELAEARREQSKREAEAVQGL